MAVGIDWPVIVTDQCAQACAEAFGLGGRQQAREWLGKLISEQGAITDQLPAEVAGRRSPSGYFVLVENKLVLPLAEDKEGRAQWIATNCVLFPSARNNGNRVDPLTLTGRQLLSQLNVLPHAIERFQQRGGGHPHPARAHQELLETIAPTVRASARPPAWCRTRPADFFLIAGDNEDFCFPCREGSGARPYDVITCIHRASDLFKLGATRLMPYCRLDPMAFPRDSRQYRLLTDAFFFSGQLSWRKPSWAKSNLQAKWWIVFSNRMAAPVEWQPEFTDAPLLVLDLADHRPLLVRLFSMLRGK